jgi:starch synthase
MKILYMTREYPPWVYGGAGVHVEHLVREMARFAAVEVRCFGDQRATSGNPSVRGYPFGAPMFAGNPRRVKQAMMALLTCMHFNADPIDADIVHCHTWYSMWGGIMAKLCYGIPLVITVHSLEPLRPWKREQLGRGYDLSSWTERTALEMADAVIAVSKNDRAEILARFKVVPEKVHVIPNGIDALRFRKVSITSAIEGYGIRTDRPYILFLGRVSRQKGILHFIHALEYLDPGIQAVLCAGAPDTPELVLEVESALRETPGARERTLWIREMVSQEAAIELYSHAAIFCCPSIYEPFGIINLEAMACETPVVASAVGGIRDVVVPGETGTLVAFERTSLEDPEPAHPNEFARDLAAAVNRLIADPPLRRKMGHKGRQRAAGEFAWDRIAEKVMAVYETVLLR